MPTYQEQIANQAANSTAKAMVAMAELADLERGLSLMVREKMIDPEARLVAMKRFVMNHPEINKALAERSQ